MNSETLLAIIMIAVYVVLLAAIAWQWGIITELKKQCACNDVAFQQFDAFIKGNDVKIAELERRANSEG
jgi:hypothetical protein